MNEGEMKKLALWTICALGLAFGLAVLQFHLCKENSQKRYQQKVYVIVIEKE